MEPEVRAFIERRIDKFLKEENLIKKTRLFKEYQKIGLIGSIENALYGALIEAIHDVTIVLNVFEGYSLTQKEMHKLLELIENRSEEIKRKVMKASAL